MTRLCLVRHGRTAWNLEGRWQGHADIPLDATGLDQAQQVAKILATRRFNAIYSSDLQRAFVTAETIASRHFPLPIQTDVRLREIHLGEWEGKLISDIPSLYPESWAERQQRPLESRPPGGESVRQLAERFNSAMAEICAAQPAEDVLVVSHGLALAAFLCHIKELPLSQAFERVPPNATPIDVEWGN